MVLLGNRLNWKLVLISSEIVLIFTQDRYTVCAERTMGSELLLTHPMELLGDVGHVKPCSSPFGDSFSVSAR